MWRSSAHQLSDSVRTQQIDCPCEAANDVDERVRLKGKRLVVDGFAAAMLLLLVEAPSSEKRRRLCEEVMMLDGRSLGMYISTDSVSRTMSMTLMASE